MFALCMAEKPRRSHVSHNQIWTVSNCYLWNHQWHCQPHLQGLVPLAPVGPCFNTLSGHAPDLCWYTCRVWSALQKHHRVYRLHNSQDMLAQSIPRDSLYRLQKTPWLQIPGHGTSQWFDHVRYWLPMDLQQVRPAPSSSVILFHFPSLFLFPSHLQHSSVRPCPPLFHPSSLCSLFH